MRRFPTLKVSSRKLDDVIFDTLDKLFAKTGISPSEIDILVVNVSLFSPAPSLSARVVNRYKMRSDIKTQPLRNGLQCKHYIYPLIGCSSCSSHARIHSLLLRVQNILKGPNW
jgi:3-ketoacyl-CoA synthase